MTPAAYHADAMQKIEAVNARWVNILDTDAVVMWSPEFVLSQDLIGMFLWGGVLGRRIATHTVTNEQHYLSVLHEVGHAVLNHDLIPPIGLRYFREAVRMEAAAWEWALENTAFPLSEEAIELASRALKSYVEDYGWGLASPADIHASMRPHMHKERSYP